MLVLFVCMYLRLSVYVKRGLIDPHIIALLCCNIAITINIICSAEFCILRDVFVCLFLYLHNTCIISDS